MLTCHFLSRVSSMAFLSCCWTCFSTASSYCTGKEHVHMKKLACHSHHSHCFMFLKLFTSLILTMNPFRKYQNTLKWILSWLKKKAAFMSALVIISVREISTTPFLFLLLHNNMPSCWFQQMLYGASESIWKWFLHVCVCVYEEKKS